MGEGVGIGSVYEYTCEKREIITVLIKNVMSSLRIVMLFWDSLKKFQDEFKNYEAHKFPGKFWRRTSTYILGL